MLAVRNLVKALIEFAEGGSFPVRPGILRDANREPLLDVSALLLSDNNVTEIRARAEQLLTHAASGHIETLEAMINAHGDCNYSLWSYNDAPAIMVPMITRAEQIPYAVMALARMSATGAGDSIAHRISKCEWCNKFFIRKTKKRSRFHARPCRIKHMNRERLDSGWFREYYLKRKAALHADDLNPVVVVTAK